LAHKKASNGKWRITKVVQPHTCITNKAKVEHSQLMACYLSHCILGLVDEDSDVSVSILIQAILGFIGYTPKYGKVWRAKQLALEIHWGSRKEAYNRIARILCAITTID
jgi:hypothetical protein